MDILQESMGLFFLFTIFLILNLGALYALKKKYFFFSKACLKIGIVCVFVLLVWQLIFVHKAGMTQEEVFAIVDQHFEFETPPLIEHLCDTFAEDMTWEAPARGIILKNHDQILEEYHKIIAGILDPVEIIPIRRFASGENVFDDRMIYFTAGKDNVWNAPEGKRMQLRLVHYFKIKNYKIHEEISYEMWKVVD